MSGEGIVRNCAVRRSSAGVVASLGFEPRQADSESAVLPLHHEAGKLATVSGNDAYSANPRAATE